MKNLKIFFSLFILAFALNSCGINMALFTHKNGSVTQVQLAKKNFKVLERVTGSATATYYLGVGGMKNRDLINIATLEMEKKANLTGTSKALINITTDVHKGGVPLFYNKITVTVSAQVIEFTE
ncbi:MAG: hypothetical protein JWO58_927 [Chitinophagaceae bacterium]|nr:hypothetical protein [Chitinophagaceae bacterium]